MTRLSRLSRMIISFMPSTALMGVRISWDMLARNADFASFAAAARSAFSLSWSSRARRAFLLEYPRMRDRTETTRTDVAMVKISRFRSRWNTEVESKTERQSQSSATGAL